MLDEFAIPGKFGKNLNINPVISPILEKLKHNTPWPGQTEVIVTKIDPEPIINLEAMYRSDDFAMWQESHLGNDLFISDPNRANRIYEAAKEGCDGSTHQEVIDDWREYLSGWADSKGLDDTTRNNIELEIDSVEDWHEKNGSLDQQGS